MTKYILNSSGVRNSADKGRKFFEEVFKGLEKNPRLLICNFAQPREDWEVRYADFVQYFEDLFGDVAPVLTLAFPENFEDQIKECDVIYMHGGDDHLVQYWLKKFDFPKIWEGKVVVTNSASSNALAQSFWTCDWRKCMDGLGILPIKFIPHYNSTYGATDPRGPIDWESAKKELENFGDKSLPIYALKEGEFTVFEM